MILPLAGGQTHEKAFAQDRVDYSPEQDVPLPVYPALHWQRNDPTLLMQLAFSSQLWVISVHSLISVGDKQVKITTANRYTVTLQNGLQMTTYVHITTDIVIIYFTIIISILLRYNYKNPLMH